MGVGIGFVVAAVVVPVRTRVEDAVLDTTLSLVIPYVAYMAAEELHGSGVLAVVVAGLVLGHKSPEIQSAGSRVTERTIWRTVQFVLENVVFLLIGLQLRALLRTAQDSAVDNSTIAWLCVGVTATVIVVRFALDVPGRLPGPAPPADPAERAAGRPGPTSSSSPGPACAASSRSRRRSPCEGR